MNIEKFIWLNTFVAIIGTILNAKQIRFGFIIWMVTNSVFMVYDIFIKSYAQSTLFGVYLVLAIYGWLSWGKKDKQETKEERVG